MHPRTLVFITLLTLCHLQATAQRLTIGLPSAENLSPSQSESAAEPSSALPEAPSQELLPLAAPEVSAEAGAPVQVEADQQTRVGETITLNGGVVVRYRDYTVRADRVVYDQATTQLDAEGHVVVSGGPYDATIKASRGEMRLNRHTARFFNVSGSMGVRTLGRSSVYSTANPMLFTGRVVLQNGEGDYRVIDGSITNCRLPKPDWILMAHTIKVADGTASMSNSFFKFLGAPIFYFPYLHHPADETGRQSGLMIPVVSNSTTRGLVLGEQIYWAIGRSADLTVGAEYYSRRGWAPNGDFRYKGPGQDNLNVRWNALFDRGIQEAGQSGLMHQGGVDITASGRMDMGPNTRLSGVVEYLSSYVYRLVFNDNYTQATSSEVQSEASLTHNRQGMVFSGAAARYQTFASTDSSQELRLLHLPGLRFDALDQPLAATPLVWGASSSMNYLGRSESNFHVRNLGRFDLYPHVSLPLHGGGWSVRPEAALRYTFYSASQDAIKSWIPTLSHEPVNRRDYEFSLDVRPPTLTRDFLLGGGKRTLRHTIEPELSYRVVKGIGQTARNVILLDTTDIATNTQEAGYSLTQRLYWRNNDAKPCAEGATAESCTEPRLWASWQVAQKYYLDPRFGNALSPFRKRRSVFDATLDLTGVDFLTQRQNLSPVVSRLRFEGVKDLRIEWDMDYDPKAGRINADNVYAGYSRKRMTLGVGHALLNALDATQSAAVLKSQELQPFLYIGDQASGGFNMAVNSGYDIVNDALQYAGVQAIYNWSCCGVSLGYRRYSLGALNNVSRDETQWLYGFTLANFGSVGDIRRSNQVFRDPSLPPAY